MPDMTHCPYCGKRDITEDGSHYGEKGVYDHDAQTYEEEGQVTEYRCLQCDGRWADALGEVPLFYNRERTK